MIEWGYVIAYYGKQYVDIYKYTGWGYSMEKQFVGHGVVYESKPFSVKPTLDMARKMKPTDIEYEYAKIEERIYIKGE